MKVELLAITGPTATGKTSLAARVASRTNGEVISADSRQVYRGMDLGTGKDLEDYRVGEQRIPFHLIDVVRAGEIYDLFRYQQDFVRVCDDIRQRGKFPVLCGGTGMYLEAVLKGYRLSQVPVDNEFRASLSGKSMEELTSLLASYSSLHNVTDTESRKRLVRALEIARYQAEHPEQAVQSAPPVSLVVGVSIDRDTRRRLISERLHRRLEAGMVEEVKQLMDQGVTEEMMLYYGLEYKYIALYLNGSLEYDEMTGKLETAIHQFAKRQMTWFRGMERRGTPIRWLDYHLPMEEKVERVLGWLE